MENNQVTKDNLIYLLNKTDKTASVIKNDNANGDVFIPRSIFFDQQEFIITSINENAFRKSKKIKSIRFPDDSAVITIEKDAFAYSRIESLYIPESISKLNEGWCHATPKLTKIRVMPANNNFIYFNDNMIIGKLDQESKEYNYLIFIRRDMKSVIIPSFIKKIGSFAFSTCLIEKIIIPPNIIEICKGAFYRCKKLKHVEVSDSCELKKIEELSFFKTSIFEIKIPSTVSVPNEKWCNYNTIVKKSEDEFNYDISLTFGLMFFYGIGTEENKELAIRYFKFIADGGNVDGMYSYAKCLYNGEGINENKKEAARYFKLAADNGNVISMRYYAEMLLKGEGINMNKKEAVHYLKLAADNGDTCSMIQYSIYNLGGVGVKRDSKEAVKYCKIAADQGFDIALYMYGLMLEFGEGIGENKEEANQYFKLSGIKEIKKLKELFEKLHKLRKKK